MKEEFEKRIRECGRSLEILDLTIKRVIEFDSGSGNGFGRRFSKDKETDGREILVHFLT